MAKLPRPSGKEMVAFLTRRGFVVIRIRGSHHFLSSGDAQTCVPVHANRPLKIGTLRSILRDIELSPADFTQAFSG